MSTTGFISNQVNTVAIQDLSTLYDSSYQTIVGGGQTTTYIVNNINYTNKDLGNIFTLYSNLTGAGYTGTRGSNCGLYYNGVDIGTYFVKSGTITAVTANIPTANMIFCYSVRLLVPTYTGPILNVKRSTDNTSADFYTDYQQSFLTTGINNTGTSMATWLGAGTATVNTIYNQSGTTNHLINGVYVFLVPYSGKYIIKSTASSTTSTQIAFTTEVKPTNLGLLFHYSDSGTGGSTIHTIISTSQDYSIRLVSNSLYGGSNNGDFLYWNSTHSATVSTYVNGVSKTAVTSSTIASPIFNSCGASVSSVSWNNGAATSGFTRMFYNPPNPNQRNLDGYFTEIIGYSATLTAIQMQDYYTKRMF